MIQSNNFQAQKCQNSVGQKTILLKNFSPLTGFKVKISENGKYFIVDILDGNCFLLCDQKIVVEDIMEFKMKILSAGQFTYFYLGVGNLQEYFTTYFAFSYQHQMINQILIMEGTILSIQINMKQKIITCSDGLNTISKNIFSFQSRQSVSGTGPWFPEDLIENPLNEWYMGMIISHCTIQILDE